MLVRLVRLVRLVLGFLCLLLQHSQAAPHTRFQLGQSLLKLVWWVLVAAEAVLEGAV
jgi:hypothetical protein